MRSSTTGLQCETWNSVHCLCGLPHGHADTQPVCSTKAKTSNRSDGGCDADMDMKVVDFRKVKKRRLILVVENVDERAQAFDMGALEKYDK